MNQALQVVPSNLQLPAHLQSPDIIAAIAAANAAAAGGVRAGGFPSISIKANRFAIKDGDETMPLMTPPVAPGQPALPMGCLEVVVVDANPALSHTFFGELINGAWAPKQWEEGMKDEPTCRSSNGVTPDADVATKQAAVCATCPQYAWGSAISKLSGKPIRACHDSKQLAVVPAGDLTYKMLGLQIKAGSLKNWGQYIQALSGRGYGVSTLVTNVTFDQTSNGVLQFTFNRFLTEAEFNAVNQRAKGDDACVIVAQSRSLAPVPALAPPAALGLPVPGTPAPVYVAPVAPPAPTPISPFSPPAPPAPPVGFGAGFGTAPAPAGVMPSAPPATPVNPAPVAATEPPKRSRRTRAEMEAAKAPVASSVDLRHVPEAIAATIRQVGTGSPAGQALLAMYPAPAQPAAPAPEAPPVLAPATPPAAAAPIITPPAGMVGFGVAPATPVAAQAPTAQAVAAGASMANRLRAKLGLPPQ